MIEVLGIKGDLKVDKEGAGWLKLIFDCQQLEEVIKIPTEKLLKVSIEEAE